MNNEFGKIFVQEFLGRRIVERNEGPLLRAHSYAARVYKQQNGKEVNSTEGKTGNIRCLVCSGGHRIWRCDNFKKLSYQEKKKLVQDCELCLLRHLKVS